MPEPISVCVPTRRGGPLLLQALTSAAGQLGPQDELCVFDNQPVPGLDLRAVEAPCPIRVVTRPRELPFNESWSAGLAAGERPWVLWLHDDDLAAPGAVGRLRAAVADRPGVVLAWGRPQYFSGERCAWEDPGGGAVSIWGSDYALARYFITNQHAPSVTLMRREALAAVLPIPASAGVVADLWLFQHLAARGDVAVVDAITVGNRFHAGTITSRNTRRLLRRSTQARRQDCADLVRRRQVDEATLRRAIADSPPAAVHDALRSLVRAKDGLAPRLWELAAQVPAVVEAPGWRRVSLGVRHGPAVLDAVGLLERVAAPLRRLASRRLPTRP